MISILLILGLIVLIAVVGIMIIIVAIKSFHKKPEKKDYYAQSRQVNENLGNKLKRIFLGRMLDEAALAELEETLIKADIGPKLSYELIEKLKAKNVRNIDEAITILKDEMETILFDRELTIADSQLNVFLVMGVNGVGKTTSIAKLARYYLNNGQKVLLAAGDTFRAAAVEQLSTWAERLGIDLIRQKANADPSGVVYDAVDAAKARGINVLIVDTAGRLHNKVNLMEELKKIERILLKKTGISKKNLLVLDATTGQNAFQQAQSFHETVGIDGIILAKYDSLSKGGIVINIEKNLNIPFCFLGIGEKIENLEVFNKNAFIQNIFAV